MTDATKTALHKCWVATKVAEFYVEEAIPTDEDMTFPRPGTKIDPDGPSPVTLTLQDITALAQLADPKAEAARLDAAAKRIYEVRGLDKFTGKAWEKATPADRHYAMQYAAAALEIEYPSIDQKEA